ncbi:hypothetical protein NIES2104_00880 [Leptolyngbya sp. NIES-2104]|nr:hypothetical protein NIES2104_00880 [Leptolyngbya sp. NIES-2104]
MKCDLANSQLFDGIARAERPGLSLDYAQNCKYPTVERQTKD